MPRAPELTGTTTVNPETWDDALDRLEGYAFLDGEGFVCHGPMGAEALAALGHGDQVAAWVEGYKARHAPIEAPPPVAGLVPSDEAGWRPALGQVARLSDWAAMFRGELWDHPWPEVLRRWVPVLLPGYAGGMTHGLIRVAHAVRALPPDGSPSDLALGELAAGLALWAGFHRVLPGRPRLRGALTLAEASARLPRPEAHWTPVEAGTFTRMDELHDFPAAVEALGPPAASGGALSDLTATFCRIMLAQPGVHPALVHTVTPVAAVRTLAPFLPEQSTEALYAQLWHVGAAVVCGLTPGPVDVTAPLPDAVPPSPDELAARAAEHGDPHAVKLTEACLREHALRPDPAYLLTARHALDGIARW